jgi:hypothetical protein
MRTTVAAVLVTLAAVAAPLAAGEPSAAAAPQPGDAVKAQVERALAARSATEQQAAFEAILDLGCRAAPAIGAVLDDGRKLPFRELYLGREPGKPGGKRHEYTPETVTDALAAILSELTWQHFGVIYNGATDEQRAKTVALWRAYLKRPLDDLCGPQQPAK